MEAVILVGVQGSGKSSFYRERFLNTHVPISLDKARTRPRELELLAECLRKKRPFVVDNTNPTLADRARYVGPAQAAGLCTVVYFFAVPLRDALRRNNQRTARQRIPVPGCWRPSENCKRRRLTRGSTPSIS
jgi:predicted kinase